MFIDCVIMEEQGQESKKFQQVGKYWMQLWFLAYAFFWSFPLTISNEIVNNVNT